MNPALLQNGFTNQYPLTSEIKYSSQDRSYPNPSVVTNEYLERRDALSSSTMNHSMALSAPPSILDFNSNHPLQDQTYSSTNPPYLLTPPQSADETSTVNNQSSSAYPYSTLPKAISSNVSNLDWNTGLPSWTPSFPGMITDMRQIRGPPMPHFSPPNPPSHFPYTRGPPMPVDPPNYRSSYIPGDGPNAGLRGRHMPMPVQTGYPGPSFPQMPPTELTDNKGPPFEPTNNIYHVVTSRGHTATPDIIAHISKGFFRVDEKWTCYRRNYFNVYCSFTLKMQVMDGQLYLQRNVGSGSPERISQWGVTITARTAAATSNESEVRGLVQHTPKRDKATESIPSRHFLAPGLPSGMSGLSPNHGLPHNNFYSSMPLVNRSLPPALEPYAQAHSPNIPNSYTFERIQFQRATANNGKRRAQQQYFHLVVNLEANIGRPGGQDEWVVVATKESSPMVVRGRSPGHYRDGSRRDSRSSMDPDGNMGHGGDGGHSNSMMSAAGNSHVMGMSWQPTNVRQDIYYGQSYNQQNETPYSSLSPESASTPTSSSSKGEDYPGAATIPSQTRCRPVSIDGMLLSPLSDTLHDGQMEYERSKKHLYEDDGPDPARSLFPSLLDRGYHHPSFEFLSTGSS